MVAARIPSATAGSEPTLVTVPQALRARVPQVELSGLTWAPTLQRYLAVVDDSIDNDSDERRAPFVVALDRQGRLDPETVPIEGIDALDDAEAITASSDGTFYLMTSHSPSRRGKVRKARRQLLHLTLDGRRLRVTGALDLLHGHDGISHQLQTLGLAADTPVDLEGLTFHENALYVGLKAPLLPDGSAVIMRLDRPGEAFASGTLGPNMLTVWAQAKLGVAPASGGAQVFEGVADLLFAGDGALYLCANSPKGWPKDGGGALWRVPAPRGGRTEAKLVRRFTDLKPEGVAAAPEGDTLTLVFDRNTLDPMWMTWPLAPRPKAGTARHPAP